MEAIKQKRIRRRKTHKPFLIEWYCRWRGKWLVWARYENVQRRDEELTKRIAKMFHWNRRAYMELRAVDEEPVRRLTCEIPAGVQG